MVFPLILNLWLFSLVHNFMMVYRRIIMIGLTALSYVYGRIASGYKGYSGYK